MTVIGPHPHSLFGETKGYESKPCGACGAQKIVRANDVLKCERCNAVAIEINRSQYLRWMREKWSSNEAVRNFAAEIVERFGPHPPVPQTAFYRMLMGLGAKIAVADRPEDCVEALFEVLQYMACPEPGWESVTIIDVSN